LASQNGFTYAYIVSPNDENWLRGAYIKIIGEMAMFFDRNNENNKFLDSIAVFKVWCQAHAENVRNREWDGKD